jgi:hypothetical protein
MAAKISKEYQEKAIRLMSLNINDETMFILIPSENDDQIYHRVDVIEETMQSKKCYCKGFARWKHCKHCTIVDTAFAGYAAAPVVPTEVVEPKVTEIEANDFYVVNSNTQVWRNEDGQWMAVGPTTNAVEIVEAHIAKQQVIAEAEEIVATPVVVKVEPKAKPVYTMSPEKLAMLAAASQEQAVTVDEPAAEAPKDNVVDIAERGALNSAQHAASFWMSLPSRQKNIA